MSARGALEKHEAVAWKRGSTRTNDLFNNSKRECTSLQTVSPGNSQQANDGQDPDNISPLRSSSPAGAAEQDSLSVWEPICFHNCRRIAPQHYKPDVPCSDAAHSSHHIQPV